MSMMVWFEGKGEPTSSSLSLSLSQNAAHRASVRHDGGHAVRVLCIVDNL
jgi:hypothetical protein